MLLIQSEHEIPLLKFSSPVRCRFGAADNCTAAIRCTALFWGIAPSRLWLICALRSVCLNQGASDAIVQVHVSKDLLWSLRQDL